MAKSVFIVRSVFKGERQSIVQIADQILILLNGLSTVDVSFLSPILSRDGNTNQIQVKNTGTEELAELLLDAFETDIKEYSKEASPTIQYSRDFGFLILLNFYQGSEKKFSITARLGSSDYQNIRLEYFNREFEYDFDWYRDVLQHLVNFSKPYYAGVTLMLPTFLDPCSELKVKHPFGWITYFSNDYELQIPDDLEGVEYEHTEKGKSIILTREDFTTGKEAYEDQRDRLIKIMKEVKKRVPEYSE